MALPLPHARSEEIPTSPGGKLKKKPFAIGSVLERVRRAVEPYPPAALFELADEGFSSPWEQLVACIISIRTRDETTLPIARAFFATARTAAETERLDPAGILLHIRPCTFPEAKAARIHEIARRVVAEHGGELPCERDVLIGFHGVGPKCAHLALGIACGTPLISVDVHVHRITHRWGYVQATTPKGTLAELETKLPERFRVDINRWLVPFGKHVCTGRAPRCSECPVLRWCDQVGVTTHR